MEAAAPQCDAAWGSQTRMDWVRLRAKKLRSLKYLRWNQFGTGGVYHRNADS